MAIIIKNPDFNKLCNSCIKNKHTQIINHKFIIPIIQNLKIYVKTYKNCIIFHTLLKVNMDYNCNNVTLEAESSQSRSHVTAIIQNFTLVSLTSTAMPDPIGLLFRAAVFFHPTHSTIYTLNSLPSM